MASGSSLLAAVPAARSAAASSLLDWSVLDSEPLPDTSFAGLPTSFSSTQEYIDRVSPLVTEEIREGVRKTFPSAERPVCPLQIQFRGREDGEQQSEELVRLSFFWGRREQSEFEADMQTVLPGNGPRSGVPQERNLVLISLKPTLPALLQPTGAVAEFRSPSYEPCMLGLVTRNTAESLGGHAWTVEVMVHGRRLKEAVTAEARAAEAAREKAAAEARAKFEAKQKWREKVRAGVKRFREKTGQATGVTADGDEDVRVAGLEDDGDEEDGRDAKRQALASGSSSIPTSSSSSSSVPVSLSLTALPGQWYCWSLGSASTALRELEALRALPSLHPALLRQFLRPDQWEDGPSSSSAPIEPKEDDGPYDRRRYLSSDYLAGLQGSMNDSQVQAIEGALHKNTGFSLIQGPPGSGKTTVLLSLLNSLHLSSYGRYHEVLWAETKETRDAARREQEEQAQAQASREAAARLPAAPAASSTASSSTSVSLGALLRTASATHAGAGALGSATAGQGQAGAKSRPVPMGIAGSLRYLMTSTSDLMTCLEVVHRAHVLRPRLLVSAPSNTAVDGILLRLLDKGMKGSRAVDGKLEVYRPLVRRVGEGAGQEVRAAPGGVHVETEVERLLGMAARPDELNTWVVKLQRDRAAILADLAGKRQWFQEQVRADPRALSSALTNVSGKVMRAVEAYETCKLKLERAELLGTLGSRDPRDMARQRGEVMRALRNSLLDEASVVFATTSSAAVGSVEAFVQDTGRPFRTVIIDEAAQATETSTLIPLRYGAAQVVLVGDPQQLPATVLSKAAGEAGWDSSLMARLAQGGTPLRMLAVQYRSHPAIMSWPARYFYGGRLATAPELLSGARAHAMHATPAFRPLVLYDVASARHSLGVAQLPDVVLKQPGTDSASGQAVALGQSQPGQSSMSSSNAGEALVIVQLLHALASWRDSNGKPFDGTVGLITFYRAQVTTLAQALYRLWPHPDNQPAFTLDIQTVDGFQGQERDVVLVSCVRTLEAQGAQGAAEAGAGPAPSDSTVTASSSSMPAEQEAATSAASGQEASSGASSSAAAGSSSSPLGLVTSRTPGSCMGFVDDPRRMNVALTRARYACLVAGQVKAMRTSRHWSAFVDHCTNEHCVVTVPGDPLDSDVVGLAAQQAQAQAQASSATASGEAS